MKVAYYIRKEFLLEDAEVRGEIDGLRRDGVELYRVTSASGIQPGTECLLSLGGDGTFLAASQLALEAGVPLLGVNFGRLGFLAGARLSAVKDILLNDSGCVSSRSVLVSERNGSPVSGSALNEVSILRKGTGAIGLDVSVDGLQLPTYWADGLLVATPSGSTAYNLSVGGPVCYPDSKVVVLSPVAPHNLGIRPLVLPEESVISIRLIRGIAELYMDNRRVEFGRGDELVVKVSPDRLETISERRSNFIDALRTRFFWGRDVRNEQN